jgi:hypothetical protein
MAEVPAKRRKLALRELELLNLDDDVLIEIIDKLDHKSKMQLMLSCKRFEGLIGNTFQFYKDFKLSLNQEMMPIEPHYSSRFEIRRKFGFVVLTGNLKNIYRSQVFEIIKNIGDKVIKFNMSDTQMYVSDVDFLKLMRFMPNLRKLSTDGWVESETLPVQPADVDFQLKRLKSFTCNIHLGNLTALIPSSLVSLKCSQTDGSSLAPILAKQEKLTNLSLDDLEIDELNYQPSNRHIKQLSIQELIFPIKSEFHKFSDFMKIQKCVEELKFTICEDELQNNNDYTEILTHLLNLKTLKKLQIECGNVIFLPTSKINICNPTVEDMSIYNLPNETDLQKLPQFFPNLTDLYISWDYDSIDNNLFMNLTPIKSMKKLRKFETTYMSEEMFAELELKQMQEFHMTTFWVHPFPNYTEEAFMDDSFDEPLPNEILESRSTSWKSFVNNNCQLQVLDMPNLKIHLELLQITLEKLPLLKSLRACVDGCNYSLAKYQPEYEHSVDFEEYQEAYVKEQAKKTAKLIKKHYDRFDLLVLKLEDDGEHVMDFLKKYPKVKVEMRSYDDTQREKSLEHYEKPFKLVIKMY